MNIQDELQKIHHQFGVSDKANYEIEKLFERLIDEHEQSRQAAVSPALPPPEAIEAEARRLYPKRDIHRHAFKKGVRWAVTGNAG